MRYTGMVQLYRLAEQFPVGSTVRGRYGDEYTVIAATERTSADSGLDAVSDGPTAYSGSAYRGFLTCTTGDVYVAARRIGGDGNSTGLNPDSLTVVKRPEDPAVKRQKEVAAKFPVGSTVHVKSIEGREDFDSTYIGKTAKVVASDTKSYTCNCLGGTWLDGGRVRVTLDNGCHWNPDDLVPVAAHGFAKGDRVIVERTCYGTLLVGDEAEVVDTHYGTRRDMLLLRRLSRPGDSAIREYTLLPTWVKPAPVASGKLGDFTIEVKVDMAPIPRFYSEAEVEAKIAEAVREVKRDEARKRLSVQRSARQQARKAINEAAQRNEDRVRAARERGRREGLEQARARLAAL